MDGDRLKRLRKEKKLTQKELGEKINVSKVSVSGYESGERTPDTDNLRRLADFFDVTSDYLLGRSDDPRLTETQQKQVDEEYKEIMEILDSLPEEKKKEKIEQIKAYAKFIRNED